LAQSKKFDIDLPLYRVDFYWHKDTFYGGEVTLTSGITHFDAFPHVSILRFRFSSIETPTM
jgi:hypothetical protein